MTVGILGSAVKETMLNASLGFELGVINPDHIVFPALLEKLEGFLHAVWDPRPSQV